MKKMSKDQKNKVNGAFGKIKNGNASNADASTVLNNADAILSKGKEGALASFFDDIKSMIDMVKAWCKKEYKGIPFKTISMVILTLVYVFCPIDVIPDSIPVIGLLDDATVVRLCLGAMRSDLEAFRNWQRQRIAC